MAGNLVEEGCGAESEPRKKEGSFDAMTARRAARSEGYLATGLQYASGDATTWSIVSARWCGVIVAPTFAGRDLTYIDTARQHRELGGGDVRIRRQRQS